MGFAEEPVPNPQEFLKKHTNDVKPGAAAAAGKYCWRSRRAFPFVCSSVEIERDWLWSREIAVRDFHPVIRVVFRRFELSSEIDQSQKSRLSFGFDSGRGSFSKRIFLRSVSTSDVFFLFQRVTHRETEIKQVESQLCRVSETRRKWALEQRRISFKAMRSTLWWLCPRNPNETSLTIDSAINSASIRAAWRQNTFWRRFETRFVVDRWIGEKSEDRIFSLRKRTSARSRFT